MDRSRGENARGKTRPSCGAHQWRTPTLIYPSPQNGRPSDFRTRQPRDDPESRVDAESRRDVARRPRALSGTRESLDECSRRDSSPCNRNNYLRHEIRTEGSFSLLLVAVSVLVLPRM